MDPACVVADVPAYFEMAGCLQYRCFMQRRSSNDISRPFAIAWRSIEDERRARPTVPSLPVQSGQDQQAQLQEMAILSWPCSSYEP